MTDLSSQAVNDQLILLNVPSWLETAPDRGVPPPVETLNQTLPLDALTWENFERLCLAMVRKDGEVMACSLYGARGQSQEGIDLYARRSSGEYEVFQCKKVQKIKSASIIAAVKKFRDGFWAGKSAAFTIFTSIRVLDPELRQTIEDQHAALAKCSVRLAVWDCDEISSRLKSQPTLVHDFFGREWARVFCVSEFPEQKNRLDAHEVGHLRRLLRTFYAHVFDRHDPGIPVPAGPGIDPVPYAERYEALDVNVVQRTPQAEGKDAASRAARGLELATQFESRLHDSDRTSIPTDVEHIVRVKADLWLAQSDRSMVIGGPGAGKSALLRYIVLDLLSDDPAMQELAARWGGRLPVWLPFRFWTSMVDTASGKGYSLKECMRQWILLHGKDELIPLIEGALRDRRLLLLVDGLDEWVTEGAGRVAADLLHVFAQESDAAIVLTSRPYGVERLPLFFGSSWQQASLAPLSNPQRVSLVAKWCHIKNRVDSGVSANDGRVDPSVDSARFLYDISESDEMAQLAAEPLMLLLLLYIWFSGSILPRKRFDAYDEILRRFLDRAAYRRAAAGTPGVSDPLVGGDVRDALAHLALEMQHDRMGIVVSDDDARSSIERFLLDEEFGLGLSRADARRHARDFTDVAEGELGILVRQGPKELGFLHRSFQEYLAAERLARFPIAQQLDVIAEHALDRRWHEVTLALCWKTRRPDELRQIVEVVQRVASESIDGLAIHEALGELAFGDYRCPPSLAHTLATETIRRVERHGWMEHRRRLLLHVVDGLRSTSLSERARECVERWVFAREGWRPGLYSAVKRWSASFELFEALLTAVYDEDPAVQRAAASTLATLDARDLPISDALVGLAQRAPSALSRAAALNALLIHKETPDAYADLATEALSSPSPEVRLVGIHGRVRAGHRDASDFAELCGFLTSDMMHFVDFAWRDLIATTLIEGWAADPLLLLLCLGGVRDLIPDARLDHSAALNVLLHGFPGNPEVARYCVDQIRNETYPFLSADGSASLNAIRTNFADDKAIAAAAETRAAGQLDSHDIVDSALLDRIAHTEAAKQRLIGRLQGRWAQWPASMLLDGWPDDVEAHDALSELARSHSAGDIAHLIPTILPATEARTRLITLLASNPSMRTDFLLEGLRTLRDRGASYEPDVVQSAIDVVAATTSSLMLDVSAFETLIDVFGDDPRVRARAIASLDVADTPLPSIAYRYGDEAAVQRKVFNTLTPLPTSLRISLVQAIENVRDDFARATLQNYVVERDDEVRTFASIAFHRKIIGNHSAMDAAAARLKLEIEATGLHYEVRRRSALAGLIVLQRLHTIPDAELTVNRESAPIVGLGAYSRPNTPLVQLVAERWDYVKTSLGAAFASRLGSVSSPNVWDAMSLAVGDFPALRADLERHLGNIEAMRFSPAMLRFVARHHARTPYLRDICVRLLRAPSPENSRNVGRVAAEILAESFPDDPVALRGVLGLRPVSIHDDALIGALSAGWPDAVELDNLYMMLQGGRRADVRWTTYIALTFARTPAVGFAACVHEALLLAPEFILPDLRLAVVRRLRRDGAARNDLADALLDANATPHARGSFPRLLREAGFLDRAIVSWCKAEGARQNALISPELGLDLMDASLRPVESSLLDAVA